MTSINEQDAKDILVKESFENINIWQDGPNFEYSEHTHEKLTAHIILEGEMLLIDHLGQEKTLKAGDRLDIPAGTVHKAKMGVLGCKYVVGEK